MAKSGAATQVWLVMGNDEYRIATEARALVAKCCPPAEQALGLEVVDGDVDNGDEVARVVRDCVSAVRTAGFFGSGRTVWFKGLGFLDDGRLADSIQVKESMAALAEEIKGGLMEGQRLIISSPFIDKRSALYKACQSHGEILDYSLPDKPWERDKVAGEIVADALQRQQLNASPAAVRAIAERCGAEARQIAAEVEKLSVYLGDRKRVEVADVQAVVSASKEAAAWDLLDAFGLRDLPGALRIFRQLIFQKESPVWLIIALEGRLRELLILRACMDRRWLRLQGEAPWQKAAWSVPADAESWFATLTPDPRTLNPFRAGKLAAQAACFTDAELRQCHRLAVQTHEQMVSTGLASETLLEFLIIRALCRPQTAPALP